MSERDEIEAVLQAEVEASGGDPAKRILLYCYKDLGLDAIDGIEALATACSEIIAAAAPSAELAQETVAEVTHFIAAFVPEAQAHMEKDDGDPMPPDTVRPRVGENLMIRAAAPDEDLFVKLSSEFAAVIAKNGGTMPDGVDDFSTALAALAYVTGRTIGYCSSTERQRDVLTATILRSIKIEADASYADRAGVEKEEQN